MPTLFLRASILCLCACAPLVPLVAQVGGDVETSTPRLRVGAQIRFQPVNAAGAESCVGNIIGRAQDTLLVAQNPKCRPGAFGSGDIRNLQVAGEDHGSRSRHLRSGLLTGALAGGLVGFAGAGGGCKGSGCDDPGFPIVAVALGTAVGELIGAVIGLGMQAGHEWRAVPVTPDLKIAVR